MKVGASILAAQLEVLVDVVKNLMIGHVMGFIYKKAYLGAEGEKEVRLRERISP